MSLLFHVIRAGHASGTHHKLALDALAQVTGPYADRWQRLFLKSATLYLEGSKAPDNQFKDFKNHVLHVREKMWGGAREKAVNWYDHLLAALRDNNWSEAAWCAGVLSHYYTDPIHPFHTGQSTAENVVHRAVEWSISRSYDALVPLGHSPEPAALAMPIGADWLQQLVAASAKRSNAHYESLLAHYDFKRGVVDPPSGIDETGRVIVGGLIRYASASFARVLERAFQESAVVPPDVNLTLATVVATLKVPMKAVLKRIDDRALRHEVEAIYDELQATGKVEKALPEEQKVVRALHAKEVLAEKEGAPGPHKLDAAEALATNKPRSSHQHRPIVPQVREAATGGVAAQAEVAGRGNRLPTPPAPTVTGFGNKAPAIAARPAAIVPQISGANSPIAAPVVPAIAAMPIIVPAPAPAPTPAPEGRAAAAAQAAPPAVVEEAVDEHPVLSQVAEPRAVETPVAKAPLAAAPEEPSPGRAAPDISPHLATAAANAAAAAVPNLGAAALVTRLRSVYPTNSSEAPTQPDAAVDARPAAAATRIRPAAESKHVDQGDASRIYLKPEQDVVDAPSIGPKTADRLKEVGIHTVADLFAADPGALAEQLDVAHIRAKTIAEWQDQARLVCEVPGLRGTHAQLLVGAGYRDLQRIARAEPRQLSADVLKYAQSTEGQRVLRSGTPPDVEKIISWVHAAKQVSDVKAA